MQQYSKLSKKKKKNQKGFISFNSFVAYSLKSLRAVVLGSWLELHFYWVWCVKTGFVVLYGTFARHSLGGGARAEVWGASCPGGWVGGGAVWGVTLPAVHLRPLTWIKQGKKRWCLSALHKTDVKQKTARSPQKFNKNPSDINSVI